LTIAATHVSADVFLSCARGDRDLPSFPTRRSSDLSSSTCAERERSPARGRRRTPRASPRARRRSSCRRATRASADACAPGRQSRSEEHTSELQSQSNLVCRLLLEKKKTPGEHALAE